MDRRTFLGLTASVGVVATAGCSAPGKARTLSDPTVDGESSQRKYLSFTADGEEIATVGVDGRVDDGTIRLPFEIWHRDGTLVEAITLRVWMPPRDAPATVAVASPVSGDSSPPPEVALSVPDGERGQRVEITDLDDLADETISTLGLLVDPHPEAEGTLSIDATVELDGGGVLASDYRLDGRLNLDFPDAAGR
ncbi:hypothetical protein [Halorientalis regularis]|jgi:hypothetical protein|uniref:DUF8121 domain-containing protein n=1 Tax=Halorientalis regularis TaxID=660518 RepID=A0A1G7MS25_9EURY|nr:hypothetical protein [Halorientalis regularis]SDF64471.1 hypothetical protein SAMN05216218_10843 [Halorientalis regularis]